MRRLPIAAMAFCLGAASHSGNGQSMQPADLAAGKVLVASKDLPDPNFAKTVILLVQYDDEGVVGLVLNRRSKIPVSRVLDDVAGARSRPDPVYAGGPVGTTEVLALTRAHRAPGDAKRVLGDVFMVSSKEAMQTTLTVTDSDSVRVYLGYAGWTEPQLENEVNLGAWYIFQGNAKAVFDTEPDSLWDRFIHQTELRIASDWPNEILKLRVGGVGLPRRD